MHAPVTLDIAETIIRDLVQGIEPRRIKIEDILRIVSRHFAVSKQDILSQRRHRSVVRPRQIGMYLAKHLTSRSLPEIGRRFGDRDHTTVLHAIRKIDQEVGENPRLKDEIEELKRQLIDRSAARTSGSATRGLWGRRGGGEGAAAMRRSCICFSALPIPGIGARSRLQSRPSRSTLPEDLRIPSADPWVSRLSMASVRAAAEASAATEGSNRRGRMQLVIERGELLRALGHVTSVVERRTTIPILSNVLLKTSERALQFKATDLEREVLDQAAADVSQPGAVTVPAHMLHDIVRKLPDGAQVEIKRDPEKERLTLQLRTVPLPAADPGAGGFSRSRRRRVQSQLRDRRRRPKRLIDKTRFAISTEETRYYLNGIYLHAAARGKQPTLRAVATDGHRLAQAELTSPKGSRAACRASFCHARRCTSCIG